MRGIGRLPPWPGLLAVAFLLASAAPARAQPDLTISKSHSNNFTAGTNGTYTLAVTNVGLSSTLAASTVTDTLPAGLTFVAGNGFGWTCTASDQVVTCVRPSFVAPGETSSLTLTVGVGAAAVPGVVNAATVSTLGDPNAANDRATDPTTVNAVDLTLDKNHAGDFTVATNGDYTLTVNNIGTAATFGTFTVVDTLPAGLTFVSDSGAGWSCNTSGQVVTCTNAGPLVPGGTSFVTLTVVPGNQAVPGVVNRARVSTAGDFDASNDADEDSTVVNGLPDLYLDKSHTGNFVVLTNETYSFLVGNVGSAATTGASTVLDTLPDGLTFVSASGAGWSFSTSDQVVTGTHPGVLAVGDTSNFTMTVSVGPSALPSVTNSATVYTAGDPNPDNDRDSDPTTVQSGSDLTIEKSHPGIFTVGIDGVYTLAITNIGSAATSGSITVQDVLPAGLSFVSASGPGWICDAVGPLVTCTHAGPINPGDTTSITLTVAVAPSAAPSVTNTAAVTVAGDVDESNNVDADPTVVTPINFALAKSHSGNFTAGSNGTYTLSVTNVGSGPSSGTYTVRDTLPAGLGFVSGSGTGWTCGASGQEVTCTNSTALVPGDSTDITLTVSAGAAAAPGVTNRATLDSPEDGTPANNVASDPTTVLAPDLAIGKSHSGDFIVGTDGVYDLVVTNAGTAGTFGAVTVRDTLPSGLTFVSGSGAGWSSSAAGQVVTCTQAGGLAPGDSSRIFLTVAVGGPAVPAVTNRAHVSTAEDSNPANDTAADPTTVIGEPDLSIAKNHSGDFVVGTDGIYTVSVTNAGNGPTTGAITVSDTLPAGLSFVSASGPGWSFGVSGSIVTAVHAGPLAPGVGLSFTLAVGVDSNAIPGVTNRAHVSIPGDPNNSNDVASDPTVVNAIDLALAKSHGGDFTAGASGTYTLTVTNVGSAPTIGAIALTDTLPAGLSFVSASGLGWSFSVSDSIVTATHAGPLAPDGSLSFTLTVDVDLSAIPGVTNRAQVSTPDDVNNANDLASDPTVVNAIDLALAKSHSGSFAVGAGGTYTLTVTSVGSAPTGGGIAVTDTLPAGLSFVSASGPGWSFSVSDSIVTALHLGSLGPGGSLSFTLTVAVGSAAVAGVTNQAHVATPDDVNNANDVASDPTVVNAVDLTLAKSHSGDFAAGTSGTYTLTVTNVGGASTIGAITVSDTLPAGLSFVSGSGPGWSFSVSDSIVTATRARPLASGGSLSFTLTVAVGAAAVPSVTNVATVTSAGDVDPANDTASDVTGVNPASVPDLSIAKSHSGDFTAGANGTYTLTVANVGGAPMNGAITVTDTLPAGLDFVSASGPGWSFSVSDSTVTALHLGPLAPGGSLSFTLTVAVGAAAVPRVTNVATVATPPNSDPANDTATDVTNVNSGPAPDLSIAKSHSGDFTAGANGTYTLTVTNVGGAPTAGPITVSDTLPAGLDFVSASGPGWSFGVSDSIVTALHLGPLGPGGSLSFPLTVAVGSAAGPVVVNRAAVTAPDDPAGDTTEDPTVVRSTGALSLEKEASRAVVEIGDVVDYTLWIRNPGTNPVADVLLEDQMPAGFAYVPGTARVDRTAIPDPSRSGARSVYAIGSMPAGATRTLTYRARIGPSAPLGEGINRAQAVSINDSVASNVAMALVQVVGGPFSDRGIIFGKVFVERDCVDDRHQGEQEPGIPGVRVFLEDGTSSRTDSEGKYHFYGLSPRTHIVHVDISTLPAGARLVTLDHRNAGDAASRFVDLKRGELHQADFAEGSHSPEVFNEVVLRREKGEITGEITARAPADSAALDSAPAPADSAPAPPVDRPRVIALGVVEGRIDLRSLDLRQLKQVRARDGFEEELQDVAITTGDEKARASTRAALYLKGKVKGDYLLTLAMDSEREVRERLFRDIQPDEFYPIYGDASVKDYDAQSANRMYVRIERHRSHLLYGDYHTPEDDERRTLGAYKRSLNGVLHHLDTGPLQLDSYVSEDRTRQSVEELPGQGVSGPYALARKDVRANSEQVEILTRDRNQPSRVLKRLPQQRFIDYQIEPFTGRLLFKAPVPSVDEALNPVSIRVAYEIEGAGEQHLVYGADGQAQVTRFLDLGGSAVRDENPLEPRRLYSANAGLNLGRSTRLSGEVARADSAGAKSGEAGRVELRHASRWLDASVFAVRTEAEFLNSSSAWVPGRLEIGSRTHAAIDSATGLRLEALRTEDQVSGGRRDGIQAAIERRFGSLGSEVRAELGFRHAEETGAAAAPSSSGATPNNFNSVRARLAAPIPGVPHLSASGEYEQDVSEAERFRALFGADYGFQGFRQRARLYARHELLSSFAGAYALHPNRRLSTTVFGVGADAGRGSHAFSEYRLRDALNGREGEAVVGLRSRWEPVHGLKLDGSCERITALRGAGAPEATAVAGALEYVRSPRAKMSLRGQFRTSPSGDDWLGSLGYARKLSRSLALLGRALYSDVGSSARTLARAQLGVAYRQTEENRWNALARYELRLERDGSLPAGDLDHGAHVVAGDLHHRTARALRLSAHVAAKLAADRSNDLETTSHVFWIGGRGLLDLRAGWDAGLMASSLFNGGFSSRREGLGLEVGRTVATNLRVAGGYNVFGFRDADLTEQHNTDHGVYLHVGFKFDEELFGPVAGGTPAEGEENLR